MSNSLKFTGTFKNLKKLDCEFMKLYARNYKVYAKDLGGNDTFWVWVAQGGYIEFKDFYNCTKLIINALKAIDWNDIEAKKSFMSGEMRKSVYIRFKHGEPSEGYLITDIDFTLSQLMITMEREKELGTSIFELPEDKKTEEYTKAYEEVRKTYDSEFRVSEEYCEEILNTYEELQNS